MKKTVAKQSVWYSVFIRQRHFLTHTYALIHIKSNSIFVETLADHHQHHRRRRFHRLR